MSATAKKRRPGRPKGSPKSTSKLVLIPQTRVTRQQLRVLQRQPGVTVADKLRRLLDDIIEQEQDLLDAKEAEQKLASEQAIPYQKARKDWSVGD